MAYDPWAVLFWTLLIAGIVLVVAGVIYYEFHRDSGVPGWVHFLIWAGVILFIIAIIVGIVNYTTKKRIVVATQQSRMQVMPTIYGMGGHSARLPEQYPPPQRMEPPSQPGQPMAGGTKTAETIHPATRVTTTAAAVNGAQPGSPMARSGGASAAAVQGGSNRGLFSKD